MREVRGNWRKLHNEKRHDVYIHLQECCYGDQIEEEIGGACATHGEENKSTQGSDGET
jgi:hypothetical protein